jgi:hypothetical protein
MKKSTAFWMSAAFLFFGMMLGFLVSPVKRGVGNDYGNHYKIEKYIKKGEESSDD